MILKLRVATKQGFDLYETGGVCDLSYPTSTKRRSRSKDLGQISGTLTSHEFYRMELVNMDGQEKIRIRKLTPKECWRLMGFSDEDFYKAQAVNSDTQLYKQAGNSICVCCLEEIIKNLF